MPKDEQRSISEEDERRDSVMSFLEGASALLELQDFQVAAQKIFAACKQAVKAEAGYVALLSMDESQNQVIFLDPGESLCTVDPTLPMPIRGLRAEAYRRGRPVYDNDFSKSEWMKFMPEGHAPLVSVLFAPMIIQGKAVGLLGLANKPGGFSDEDCEAASLYAHVAAISLQNSLNLQLIGENEQRFHSIVQTANDAIMTVDSSGNMIHCNDGTTKMFGYSPSEMIGKPLTVLMPERLIGSHIVGFKQAASSGELKESRQCREMIGVRKNGEEFPIELSIATWKVKGEPCFTGIIRDITERKMLMQSLQQANRKLSLLSSLTRHDGLNQISIIRAYAQLLKEDPSGPRAAEFLAKISEASEAIENQLEFSRDYQSVGTKAPQWQNLHEVVEKASSGLAKKEVSIMSDACEAEVYADLMLENVFNNLFENALRHGARVSMIKIICEERPEGMTIAVEDDGIGIPNDEKKMIFERGFGKHTGLGLYLAKEILAITGISIIETGVEGSGARFEILIPNGKYRKPKGN